MSGSDQRDDEDALSWKALEYIGDVTANAKCPFCGNENWVFAQNEREAPRRALLSYRSHQLPHILPAIALICDRCGNVRYHDIAMIKTKLDEHGGNG